MGLIGDFKDAAYIVQKIGNIDLYGKILNLQSEAMELLEKLQEKDKKIAELEAALSAKKKMVFDKRVYYEADKDGKPSGEPYCPLCYDSKGLLVHLDTSYDKPYCHNCRKPFNQHGGNKPTPGIGITHLG